MDAGSSSRTSGSSPSTHSRGPIGRWPSRRSKSSSSDRVAGSGSTISTVATDGLWAASGFFETLATAESLDFSRRYAERFGVEAPVVGSLGESCFEGLRLLAALAERARSLDVRAMRAASGSVAYEGPRGALRLRGNHLDQRCYLARADAFDFHVIAQL